MDGTWTQAPWPAIGLPPLSLDIARLYLDGAFTKGNGWVCGTPFTDLAKFLRSVTTGLDLLADA